MKYVVKMKKIVEEIVVVEANSDEEADKKMMNWDIEKEYSRRISDNVYNGFEYESHYAVNNDELITCADDIARLIFGGESEKELDRLLFKYTNCGMCATWDKEKINLVGYVEGCDGEMPNQDMYFPFTVEYFNDVMARLEDEAEYLWHHWNDENGEELFPF